MLLRPTGLGAQGVRISGRALALNGQSPQARNLVRCYPLDGAWTRELRTKQSFTGSGVVMTGHPIWSATSYFGSSSYCDVDAPAAIRGVSAFSLALWCRTNTTTGSSGGGGLRYLASTEDVSSNGQFILRYEPSSTQFQAYVLPGVVAAATMSGVLADTDYHVGMTVSAASGGTVRLFVNGVEKGNATGVGALGSTANAITFGNDGGFDLRRREWNGWLAHAVLYDADIGANGMWALYDPATRWDLYWQPSSRVFFYVGAVVPSTRQNRLLSLGVA